MTEIRQTDGFARWLRRLTDRQARAQILVRLRRLSLGNPGDVTSVGDGVFELRIHAGPGYRVYFAQGGVEVVVLLIAGDKSSQKRDVLSAKSMAQELRENG